jgi:hypothetical protein
LFSLLFVNCATQVLGTPTGEEIKAMNENYTDFRFPVIKANPWTKVSLLLFVFLFLILIFSKVFNAFTPPDAISLISHLLT